MNIPEQLLEQLWDETNWNAAEEKLTLLQADLTLAVFRQDKDEIE